MIEIVITIILILLIGIVRFFVKEWCNPAYIMTCFWAINIILALITFYGEYVWQGGGLLYIIIAISCFAIFFSFGELGYQKKCIEKVDLKNGTKILPSEAWMFIWICIIIGVFRFLIDLYINGFSLADFFELRSLLVMNNVMAQARYSQPESQNMIVQLMLVFVYGAPLIGGYSFVLSKTKMQKFTCVCTITPNILTLLLNNTKVAMIACGLFWISGYVTSHMTIYKQAPKIQKKNLIKISLILGMFFSLLYMSMILRTGQFTLNSIAEVNQKVSSYSLGHVLAFDSWMNGYLYDQYLYAADSYSAGKYTFYGLAQTLGIERAKGVYLDNFYFGNVETNVYTAFRGVILDFGIIGSLIVYMFTGLVLGYLFKKAMNAQYSVLGTCSIASLYFWIGYSFIISSWTYLSYILAFILFGVYLLGLKYIAILKSVFGVQKTKDIS